MKTTSPLSGIIVIDHTSALAGPYCTQLLGDLGAEVIKLERPGSGDQSRGWGPPFLNGESAYFLGTNRNKKSVTLNLGEQQGRDILNKLILRADILIQNVPRQSSREKLGLGESSCRELNPKLIWGSISGFGNSGPLAEKPGYDVIAQAMSGTMAVTGEVDGGPVRFPTPIADISAGMYMAMAILAALYEREKSGEGQVIDIALLDSQVTWLANIASNHLATGDPVQRMGNAHPSITPYQPFPTADGWIMVGAGNENLWQKLISVLELQHLAEDARFTVNAERLQNREALVEILTDRFASEDAAHWLEKLDFAGVPAAPIYIPEDSLRSEQVLAREMVVELEHPAIGAMRTLGTPMKFSRTGITFRLPPPTLGEHTEEVLSDLGYSDEDVQALRSAGVV